MKDKSSLLPLKMLVISMGLLLIGGTIFLFSVIANKASKDLSPQTACEGGVIHVGDAGKVISATTDGKTTHLALAKGDKTTLLTVDNCSQHVLNSITIVP